MGRIPNDRKVQVVNIRMVKEPSLYSTEKIRTPEDAVRIIADELATYDREVFAILNVKSNGQPINLNICSVGTIDSSMVSPREIFKSAILQNSSAFIAIHNHPSGSLAPSQEDKDVTSRLLACSDLLGIKMLDHIIVAGDTGALYSFKSDGMLDQLRPGTRAWEIAERRNYMAENRNNGEVTFEIMEHVGVIEARKDGWTKEVNIVAWNGGQPKIDIRDWSPDHERMTRGITLTEEQAEKLTHALVERYRDKAERNANAPMRDDMAR